MRRQNLGFDPHHCTKWYWRWKLNESQMSSCVLSLLDFKSQSILQYFEQAIFVHVWTIHFVSDVQEIPGQQFPTRSQGQPAVCEDRMGLLKLL